MNTIPFTNRLRILKLFATVFGVVMLALTATPSEALKPRPTVDSVDACISGKGDKSCDGLICSCCYNEGCWICGDAYYDCEWDPAYRKQSGARGRLLTVKPPIAPGVLEPGNTVPRTFSTPQLNAPLIAK